MVSAAAGSVGHLVGQIAKIKGARVVGVCGSDAKAELLVSELDFDAAVNYRDDDFRQTLKDATPDGVDVYFDNTGGMILGSALFRMNVGGRIACCGVVSQYDTSRPEPGPKGIPGLLVNKRLNMRGFLVFDYVDRYSQARDELRGWLDSGELNEPRRRGSGARSGTGSVRRPAQRRQRRHAYCQIGLTGTVNCDQAEIGMGKSFRFQRSAIQSACGS